MRFMLTLGLAALAAPAQDYLHNYPTGGAPALEPRLKAALAAAPPVKPYSEMKLAEVRDLVNRRILSTPKRSDRVARVQNRKIPGPRGPIPVRYTPDGKGRFPVIVFLHGGGWILGNLDTHDDYCRSLSKRAGAVVLSVDYRLAPENAAVALMARDKGGPKIALQVLIYPATNDAFDTASAHQNASGFGLSRDAMIYFWGSYLGKPSDGENPYASPLRAKDLRGLPRALVITAQFDPLRDDGLAYAARLSRAGVPVRCTNYLDMNHGFALFGAVYESARKAMEEAVAELRSAWGSK
jgi:acetyl esterase